MKDDNNQWVWEDGKLQRMATEFYQKLLTEEDLSVPDNLCKNQYLTVNVTDEEAKQDIFDMKPLKAPGSDGYQPYFYQTQWQVVGREVYNFVRAVFDKKKDVAEVSHSFLVLLLKATKSEFIHHFRPIGLCNVSFKVLTKILVNRL